MSPLTLLSWGALLAGPAFLSTSVNAQSPGWHFDIVKRLMTARVDPIVDPGVVSPHMHRIMGGSNFAAEYSYDNNQGSDCSTVYTTFDKSNYWTAQMYWVNGDANTVTSGTTYTPIPANHRFYYFLTRNQPDEPVSPFPEGLRMLAGNKSAKAFEDTGFTQGGMTYTCQIDMQDTSKNKMGTSWNDFDVYCPEVKMELKFPSCWDGVNLYSEDGSHMTYPDHNIMYGACPMSHPIRLPAIMFEVTWLVNQITTTDKPKNRMILSNGDTTAFGSHVDFANGWDTDILSKALNDPACVGKPEAISAQDCPVFQIDYAPSRDKAEACKPMRGQPEDEGAEDLVPVNSLPGWSSGPKPTCAAADDKLDISAFLGVTTQSFIATSADTLKVHKANILSGTATSWQKVGCINDDAFNSTEKTLWHNWNTMTIDTCQDWCATTGMPYAALERGYQCSCSPSMWNGAAVVDDGKCNTPCKGDASVDCGADGLMMAFYKPTVKAEQPSSTDKTYMGCYVDETITGGESSGHYDIDSCRTFCKGKKYFALKNSKYCDCSGDLATPQGWETRVPEAECNTKCLENSAQTCGGNQDGIIFQSVYLVDGEVDVGTTTPDETTASATSVAPATSYAAPTPVGAAQTGAAAILDATAGPLPAASAVKSIVANVALVGAQPVDTASPLAEAAQSSLAKPNRTCARRRSLNKRRDHKHRNQREHAH